MSFALESGYIPQTVEQLMSVVKDNVNTQFGTTYTDETFLGTNFYKYFYALIQELQKNEVKTAEIFSKLQEYFRITNEVIQRPKTTHPGIYDVFKDAGYSISTKPPIDADAGKAYICVDLKDNHARGRVTITNYANLVSGTDDTITIGATVFTAQTTASTPGTPTFQAATSNDFTASDLAEQINAHATAGALVIAKAFGSEVWLRAVDGGTDGNSIALVYTDNDSNVGATVSDATLLGGFDLDPGEVDYDDKRLTVCQMIKDCVVAGVVTQGTEIEEITLSNGQAFEFKFNLPNRIPVLLRLTTYLSENNLYTIASPDDTKQKLYENMISRYKLGKNFEPQRYFSVVDAPWASHVLLEWSDDGGSNWYSNVYDSAYDDLFTFDQTSITLVEA